jgi:hypothetical protein
MATLGSSRWIATAALFGLLVTIPLAQAAPPWGTTTDWRIGRIWTFPLDPPPGIHVLFLAEVSASRSDGSFPQEVSIAAYLDGYPIGSGRVLMPALGTPVIFCAGGGWNATLGMHSIRFIADPKSLTNDPNRADNMAEASFEVGARAPAPGLDFSLSVEPDRRVAELGKPCSYTISIEPKGNATEAVALALWGLPEGVPYYFDPPFGEPPLRSRLIVYLPDRGLGGAPIRIGEYHLMVLAMAGRSIRTATVALEIGPPAAEATATMATTSSATTASRVTKPPAPALATGISFYRAVLIAFAIALIALAAYYMLKERRAKPIPIPEPAGSPSSAATHGIGYPMPR